MQMYVLLLSCAKCDMIVIAKLFTCHCPCDCGVGVVGLYTYGV